MKPLPIAPNKPLTVSLVDPEGQFDFDTGIGQYQTTTGQLLQLPRPAVLLLNELEPQPGEEIVITKHWSGRPSDKSEWTVALSPSSEQARAKAESLAQDQSNGQQAAQHPTQGSKSAVAPPTPIRKPLKRRQPAPELQPRLFDRRGTGTHGPAPELDPEQAPRSIPLPAVAIGRPARPFPIPANVAVTEILEFINADPGTANWSDQARQDLASTVYIAAVKQGQVGLWERHQ